MAMCTLSHALSQHLTWPCVPLVCCHATAKTAALLAERGIELEVIWDEGTVIMRDGFPPITNSPFALVATAEKGYQSVQVSGRS